MHPESRSHVCCSWFIVSILLYGFHTHSGSTIVFVFFLSSLPFTCLPCLLNTLGFNQSLQFLIFTIPPLHLFASFTTQTGSKPGRITFQSSELHHLFTCLATFGNNAAKQILKRIMLSSIHLLKPVGKTFPTWAIFLPRLLP